MGRFRHKSALVAVIAIASGLAICIGKAQTIQVDVKLVRLLVSVKDAKGQLVGSLEKPDFTVFDTGVKQDIAVFEHHTAVPLSVSLLLDTSGSTSKELRYETTSLQNFLHALLREGNPDDTAALYGFNDQVTRLNSFTRREQRLSDSLKDLRASAGTSLYDAVYLASQRLSETSAADGRRRVVVLITDGGDTVKGENYTRALEQAQRAGAMVYSIIVVPIYADAGRNTAGEHALIQMARDTGGKYYYVVDPKDLEPAFRHVSDDLRTQYLLGYYAPRRGKDDSYRTIKVRMTDEALQGRYDLRYRAGYYADAR